MPWRSEDDLWAQLQRTTHGHLVVIDRSVFSLVFEYGLLWHGTGLVKKTSTPGIEQRPNINADDSAKMIISPVTSEGHLTMAAKHAFEPHEIQKTEPTRHTWYSVAAGSELEDFSLLDESTTYLLDDAGMTLDGFDLTKMFQDYDPQQLIQVIGKHGVMLLGDMQIDDWLMRRQFEGRTTLTIGRDEMHLTDWKKMWMDHLMGGGQRLDFSFDSAPVKVEAFVVTIRNAAGVRQNGLLYPLIKRWEADACPMEVWGLATVRALVSYKWNHWAKRFVSIQFVIYVCWVVSFIALALSFEEPDMDSNMTELWQTGARERGLVVLVIWTQLLMFPFTYLAISRIRSSAWQWFNFWNIIDVFTQSFQVVSTVVYLSGSRPGGFDILLGAQVVLLIAKIQFYARAFVAVDSSMLDTLKAVVGSIRWYLLLLVLTVYSFACALYILYRKGYSECEDFKDMLRSIMTMFSLMLSEWEISNYLERPEPFNQTSFDLSYNRKHPGERNETHYTMKLQQEIEDHEPGACFWRDTCSTRERDCSSVSWLTYRPTLEVFSIMLFLCTYMVVMSILFYHLLIAMVIDAHSRQMEVKKLWVHLSRAEIINILETALPQSMTQKYVYSYIHVLRVIPMRSANMDKIWHQVNQAENTAERRADEFEAYLHTIQSDILSRIEVDPLKASVQE